MVLFLPLSIRFFRTEYLKKCGSASPKHSLQLQGIIFSYDKFKKRRSVLAKGNPVELTFTEFQILFLLAGKPGWVFTRFQIVDAVRGDDYPVTDRSVDVQIVGLRKKLGTCGKHIETVRGVGYRFKDIS
jgi:DNA-binding response OmpR family regulator